MSDTELVNTKTQGILLNKKVLPTSLELIYLHSRQVVEMELKLLFLNRIFIYCHKFAKLALNGILKVLIVV